MSEPIHDPELNISTQPLAPMKPKKKLNKGLRKRKETLRNKVVPHHIAYEYNGLTHKQEEIVVPIYNNEHWLVGHLQKRGKYVSEGFLQTLKHFIWLRETTGNFVRLELPPKADDTIKEEKFCECPHSPGTAIPVDDVMHPVCNICHKPLKMLDPKIIQEINNATVGNNKQRSTDRVHSTNGPTA